MFSFAEQPGPDHRQPFPRGVQFTPVPNPVLAGLLQQITSISELKVTLRVIWALHRKKSPMPSVTAEELFSDRAVAAMLGVTGEELEAEVEHALGLATARGTLLSVNGADGEQRYLLNTDPVRTKLARKRIEINEPEERFLPGSSAETQQADIQPELHEGVYRVYEQNIGVMSPLIAESITAALQEHPESDVIDAMRVAVEANARSWKYVLAVLNRWAVEGRDGRETRGSDGKPERHSEADSGERLIQRSLERQRARGRR